MYAAATVFDLMLPRVLADVEIQEKRLRGLDMEDFVSDVRRAITRHAVLERDIRKWDW